MAVYSEVVRECGCRGVPEGVHLPGCKRAARVRRAPVCSKCGYRGVSTPTDPPRCPFCGEPRKPGVGSVPKEPAPGR